FPEIAAKRHERAAALSGGQQQMLAVAQGLVRRPRLLMLDEPSAGLSPVLVDRVLAAVARLRESGTAVLLVEHHADLIFDICDRVTVLNLGKVLAAGTPAEIRSHREVVSAYLGA
ncbi:MAG TPA: ATP-binding cassette domain-containing protein, partial [Reyranella sp.]